MPDESRRRWTIRATGAVRAWLRELRTTDPDTYRAVNVAIDILAETAPASDDHWWTPCTAQPSATSKNYAHAQGVR